MKNGLDNGTMSFFNDVLASIKTVKQAAVKSAVGETSHPVKNVDDGTVPAAEGARSKENASDIKKNVGAGGVTGQEDANSVKEVSTKGNGEGSQPQSSDEVKGNVPTPKAAPEKPGTGGLGDASAGHPSNQTFEQKYSSVVTLGNKIAADIAVLAREAEKEVAAKKPAKKDKKEDEAKPVEAKKAEAVATPKAEEKKAEAPAKKVDASKLADFLQGVKVAAALDSAAKAQEKKAEAEVVSGVTKTAEADAEAYCEFLKGFVAAQNQNVKKAEQVKLSEEDKFKIGYEIGNELRKEASAGTLTGAKLEAGLTKLAEMTGEVVAPEDLAAMLGAPGADAAAAAPVAPEVAPEAAGVDPEIMAIAQALAEQGVTEEELVQALSEADAGGGAAPEAAVVQEAAAEGEPVAQEVAEQEEAKEEKE